MSKNNEHPIWAKILAFLSAFGIPAAIVIFCLNIAIEKEILVPGILAFLKWLLYFAIGVVLILLSYKIKNVKISNAFSLAGILICGYLILVTIAPNCSCTSSNNDNEYPGLLKK